MEDIDPIYYNNFGIAFFWKRTAVKDYLKIQLVFRDTGLLLDNQELSRFGVQISKGLEKATACSKCRHQQQCRQLLLESPLPQLNFAVSLTELRELDDLIQGTLFQLNFDNTINRLICSQD